MLRKISLFTLLLTYCAFTHSNDLTAASALSTFTNAKTTSEYRSALQQFQTLYDENPKDADLAFYLGRSLYHQGRFEEADDVLSRNIKRYPNHSESHYVLGSVKLSRVSEVNLFKKAGMAKAAVAAWEKTVELEPDHVEAMYGVVEFYFVAPGFAGGDDDLAKLRLQELESISAPWANLSKASRAQEAESFEESERLFNLAINGIPNRAFPQMMLANLYMKLDKHEKALSALETYKRRTHTWNDPGPAPTELMAAKIYQSLERKQDAISSLEIVMRENPQPNILDQAQNLLKELK